MTGSAPRTWAGNQQRSRTAPKDSEQAGKQKEAAQKDAADRKAAAEDEAVMGAAEGDAADEGMQDDDIDNYGEWRRSCA